MTRHVCLWKAVGKERQERKRKESGREGRNRELGKPEYAGQKVSHSAGYYVLVTYL